MWVVKLGGSLAHSPHLPLWLDAVAATDAVIVPGGGPFADAVRHAQKRWRFDETTAHHMAILGMRQYGRMLMGLCPALRGATTPEELRELDGHARVWLPMPEILDEAGIPASWDITSDSLAAWLAGQINASNLLLVKSVSIQAAPLSSRGRGDGVRDAPVEMNCEQLVNLNWVDPVFPEYGLGPFSSWLCGLGLHIGLAHALADPSAHFIRIRFDGQVSVK